MFKLTKGNHTQVLTNFNTFMYCPNKKMRKFEVFKLTLWVFLLVASKFKV